MAAKTTAKKQSKSDFIRQQPSTLSAAEVVEKAKATGVPISSGLVYEVRSQAKRKPKKAAATKVSKAVTQKTPQTKADFVRAHAKLSPKDIVGKAKLEGIKLDTGYVYNVRGADRAAAEKKRTSKKASQTAIIANGSRPPVAASDKAEDLLKAIAAEVGLGRAIELLEAERARVHSMLRG
jgi:hypothetical protein